MDNNDKDNSARMHVLQDLLTDEFIERIKLGDAEPSLLNAARQYLKDNGIHEGLKQDTKIQDLISVLPFKEEEEGEEAPISNVN
tara:strand:+ start:415 stop:666 length:252 start_codon:yes stop_codon:yes gene_type:complete